MNTMKNQADGVHFSRLPVLARNYVYMHRPTQALYSPCKDRAALHDPILACPA